MVLLEVICKCGEELVIADIKFLGAPGKSGRSAVGTAILIVSEHECQNAGMAGG